MDARVAGSRKRWSILVVHRREESQKFSPQRHRDTEKKERQVGRTRRLGRAQRGVAPRAFPGNCGKDYSPQRHRDTEKEEKQDWRTRRLGRAQRGVIPRD